MNRTRNTGLAVAVAIAAGHVPSVSVRLDWRSGVNFTVTRMRMGESLLAAADAVGRRRGRAGNTPFLRACPPSRFSLASRLRGPQRCPHVQRGIP